MWDDDVDDDDLDIRDAASEDLLMAELRILDAIGGEGALVDGSYYFNGMVFSPDGDGDDDLEDSPEFWDRVRMADDAGYEDIF